MLSSSFIAPCVGLLFLFQSVVAQPQCRKVVFRVTAKAENEVYTDLPDPNDSFAISEYVKNGIAHSAPTKGITNVTGTYDIVGHYCQPPACKKAKGVLQYFIHGSTYNQTVWTGLDLPNAYNWVHSATEQGYHTLTLDSLGHGENPDRPDPFSIVQSPLQAEINHQILSQIRKNVEDSLGQTFKPIVLVAHSYGSAVGVNLLRSYPNDVEAFVMTGWSTSLSANAAVALDYVPGSDVYPDRLRGLDKGYVTPRTAKARQGGFYAGDFDPSILLQDFTGGDTVGVGEILSISQGMKAATEFTGPVLAVTGDMDALLCDPQFGSCSQILKDTASLFPAAESYQYYIVPRTGHDFSLHYSAPQTAAIVGEWLHDTVL